LILLKVFILNNIKGLKITEANFKVK